MAAITADAVNAAISSYEVPYLGTDLVSAKCVKNVDISDQKVTVDVVLGFPAKGYVPTLQAALREAVSGQTGAQEVVVNASSKVASHAVQQGTELLKNVKNIIAVASGKGGVGKSTVSANLALALAAEGATVGMLDADVYGPSQPRMLGASGGVESTDGNSIEPKMSYGVQSMSIGYVTDDEETAMIWRGPMATQALDQLLRQTNWRDVDYLIIDLPPGTGDIQITLAQRIPVSGAIIVTTPQDIALLDARKGLKMFEKVNVPVLGIVENMSIHVCSKCGHEEHIFGSGGGEKMSQDYGVELLGSLPLDINIRADADSGKPTVVNDPNSRAAEQFKEVARNITAKLSQKAKDYRQAFPNIVIQTS